MASAEQLRIAHSIEGKVMGVDDRVQDVGDDVQDVAKKVKMRTTRFKLSVANWTIPTVRHLLLLMLPFRIPNARAYSQGTYSATIFYDGFPLQIHP